MKVYEIMNKYTTGEMELEEANEKLKAEDAIFHLDPDRNVLTEAEKEETLVGIYPHQARGWGLLDTGTVTLDKVEVVKGILPDTDLGVMPGLLWIAGRCYHIEGNKLVE